MAPSACERDRDLKALFYSFERTLSGLPDTIISVCLVVSGIAIVAAAAFAPRTIKLLLLAWIWFP
jgi:hypothetical protein